MMGVPVRLSCVSLAAYPVEFVAKMSNVRLPFVSLSATIFNIFLVSSPRLVTVRLVSPSILPSTVTVIDYNPLNITSFAVSSDNSANSSYAKVGDEIKITIATDGTFETVLGSILGDTNLTVTNRGDDTRNILKIVAESDTNGNLTFDILATNSTGYAARLTQDNLTGTPIIIDTLPPALTLNGNNDTTGDTLDIGFTNR